MLHLSSKTYNLDYIQSESRLYSPQQKKKQTVLIAHKKLLAANAVMVQSLQ